MPLSVEEREEFLAGPHVAALAVDAGDERRGPVNVPVWYVYRPGGDFVFVTGRASRKAQLIADAECFTLMVDRTSPTYRYVSVEGELVSVAVATRELAREIAARYLPTEQAVAEHVERIMADPEAVVAITMRPRHWLSADIGGAS
ncbi:pyridoxamine 5'-phosphate oxidase family protein [Streptomyces sp. ISL-11]|uniref:pyridoxamine 5'-phosphate oxidase family protein n=1 Tax=Streptomyces sp. ISL-11 TaxID=2819174 RepID=UPI001BECC07B|nr:pyridoxamine 5'-phosphate oxidase family protein [Streptomyces sp. ISL-11]MBT2384650.1 pyridoxamine 5'-phosphate oxidase family protein [Streptomyces sp. ISL-11]